MIAINNLSKKYRRKDAEFLKKVATKVLKAKRAKEK
jgi:hypothetical protein